MKQVARIDAAQPLTAQQATFVAELMEHGNAERAKLAAAYPPDFPTVRILRGKLVQSAIVQECDAKINGELRVKALKTLEQLLDSGPAATKFSAARLVLEWGEGSRQKGDDKPLTEMPIDELEALIRQKEAELQNVTPDNGAHP